MLMTVDENGLTLSQQEIDHNDYDLGTFNREGGDLDRIVPDGSDGLLLMTPDVGRLYRISSQHVLSQPLEFYVSGDRVKGEADLMVGNQYGYIIVRHKDPQSSLRVGSAITFNLSDLSVQTADPLLGFAPPHAMYVTDSDQSVYAADTWIREKITPASYAGFQGGPTAAAAAPPPVANTVWSRAKGSALRGDNSTIAYLTNEYAGTVFFKFENCFDGFGVLEGGSANKPQKFYLAIDGIRPPAWFPDWAKSIDGGRLIVTAEGEPQFRGRNLFPLWDPCDGGSWACDHFAGWKREPGWSEHHPDWKYPSELTRDQACGPGDLQKPRAR